MFCQQSTYHRIPCGDQQYNVGAPFEEIVIDVACPFARRRSGISYLLVIMDYFALPNQEAQTVSY